MIQNTLKTFGYKLTKVDKNVNAKYPVEFNKTEKEIFDYVRSKNLTMVSDNDLFPNLLIAKYLVENNIKGDFVECGVWRGGSTMAVKLLFDEYNFKSKCWLFDTFQGMVEPKDIDFNY